MSAPTDTLRVEFRVGDTATVSAYGYGVRVTDTGRRVTVTGFTARGNLTVADAPGNAHDPTARGRSIRPGCLLVARRDGQPGHEGNAR